MTFFLVVFRNTTWLRINLYKLWGSLSLNNNVPEWLVLCTQLKPNFFLPPSLPQHKSKILVTKTIFLSAKLNAYGQLTSLSQGLLQYPNGLITEVPPLHFLQHALRKFVSSLSTCFEMYFFFFKSLHFYNPGLSFSWTWEPSLWNIAHLYTPISIGR